MPAAPADHREGVVHGVAAEDERRHEHQAKRWQPQQQEHPRPARPRPLWGARRSPAPRARPYRAPGGHLPPDNHVEAPGAHRLSRQQGASNEGRRARPTPQPYSNPRRPLLGGGTAAPSAKASARMVTVCQRCGMPQAQRQERPEALRREIAQGHPGGQHEADHQYEAESLYEVAEAPGEGRREQADGRAGLSTSPSCAAGTPRALTKAGRKGDATPKAAYSAA